VAQLDIKGTYYFKRKFPWGWVEILAKIFEKDAECVWQNFEKMGENYST